MARRGYAVAGLVLWLTAFESGIHPTIAGMAMGFTISAYPPQREARGGRAGGGSRTRVSPAAGPMLARSARLSVAQALSPNERIQATLHPRSSYVIVPLFALANAGVDLRGDVLGDAVSLPVS